MRTVDVYALVVRVILHILSSCACPEAVSIVAILENLENREIDFTSLSGVALLSEN